MECICLFACVCLLVGNYVCMFFLMHMHVNAYFHLMGWICTQSPKLNTFQESCSSSLQNATNTLGGKQTLFHESHYSKYQPAEDNKLKNLTVL